MPKDTNTVYEKTDIIFLYPSRTARSQNYALKWL